MTNDKLKDVILYACWVAQELELPLSSTKLLKSVVFSDVQSFIDFQCTISGADIVKGPHGPIPHDYLKAIECLEQNKLLVATALDKSTFYTVPNGLPQLSLSVDERRIIEDRVRLISPLTASEVSKKTHDEDWERTPMGHKIPLGAYLPGGRIQYSSEDLQAIAEDLKARGLA